ncbi:MAG: hypothetical protein IKI75_03260 [Lachnospiraceae bacterium]|nr:hypothetical protein [Lachnospiraceae bacterium]
MKTGRNRVSWVLTAFCIIFIQMAAGSMRVKAAADTYVLNNTEDNQALAEGVDLDNGDSVEGPPFRLVVEGYDNDLDDVVYFFIDDSIGGIVYEFSDGSGDSLEDILKDGRHWKAVYTSEADDDIITLTQIAEPENENPAETTYSVTLSGGSNATVSGNMSQSGLEGAMETVTFTAAEGYRFERFEDISSNGIIVVRNDEKTVTVSGTPVSDVEITIPDAVKDTEEDPADTGIAIAAVRLDGAVLDGLNKPKNYISKDGLPGFMHCSRDAAMNWKLDEEEERAQFSYLIYDYDASDPSKLYVVIFRGDEIYDVPDEPISLKAAAILKTQYSRKRFYYYVTASDIPEGVSLRSISIDEAPEKTEYLSGERFDTEGMVVTAHYSDNSSRPIKCYVCDPGSHLRKENDSVVVKYMQNGIVYTAKQPVTVTAGETVVSYLEDVWNLFECDQAVYEFNGVSAGGEIKNSNSASQAYYDAVFSDGSIRVSLKPGVDRKKAANKDNSVLSFTLSGDRRVDYVLPVTYTVPSLKLSSARATIKKDSSGIARTTVLVKEGSSYVPLELESFDEVKFNGTEAELYPDGCIGINASQAATGEISVKKSGWEKAIELKYTIKAADKDVLTLDTGAVKTVVLNSNAAEQVLEFPIYINGEKATAVSVTVADSKKTGIASVENGYLRLSCPAGKNLIGSGTSLTLSAPGTTNCKLKVKFSNKALSDSVKLKIKSKYDIVTGEAMVVTPTLKYVSGTITAVTVDTKGFDAKLASDGNIILSYNGNKFSQGNTDIGDMKFSLTIDGVKDPVDITLKNVKAKKGSISIKSAKTISMGNNDYEFEVISNVICTYKGIDGKLHQIIPKEIEQTFNEDEEAMVTVVWDNRDKTLIYVSELEKNSVNAKLWLDFDGDCSKSVSIKIVR